MNVDIQVLAASTAEEVVAAEAAAAPIQLTQALLMPEVVAMDL